MKITGANVYCEDGVFRKLDVRIEGDRIVEIGSEDNRVTVESRNDRIIDGNGCYLIPGLTDIHFHGCMGYDFCDGTHEAIRAMALYEASQGITTIVPATMTLAEGALEKICYTAATWPNAEGAILCGINMEGPFISMERKGAQNGEYIHQPDARMFRRLNQASGGMVKLLAIAPEVEGAAECIRELKDEVVLSAAHTMADYEQAAEAFRNGIHHVTHLYNAMEGLSHRKPGLVGAAADNEDVEAELICDGIHIHPVTVRQTFKMFGAERIILISDSMEATGMPDGEYMLGGQKVFKKGNRAALADGTIAGSVTNLMDCLRVAVREMGIPLESAIRCAAVNSAKSVGIYDQYGSITIGKMANLVLLDESNLSTKQVILKGRIVSR